MSRILSIDAILFAMWPLANAFKPVTATLLAFQAVIVITPGALIHARVLPNAPMDVLDALIQFAIRYWCCILMVVGELRQ